MRIIGYNDPRNLNKLKEWKELKEYHHFCISQTLVQGLSREYGRSEFKILTTIDKLVKKFYREWTNNTEKDVKHFLDIRRYIEEIENEYLKKSFIKNKLDVYNSIKLLLECNIESKDLEKENLTKDKKEFLNIYKKVEKNPNWAEIKELDSKTIYSFKEALKEILIDEIIKEINIKNKIGGQIEFCKLEDKDKNIYLEELIKKLEFRINKTTEKKTKKNRLLKERLEMYKNILTYYEKKEVKKVIFHGVHQFTPIIIKLIKYLEKNNIEVIFLINYNEEFKRLYSTWDKVYNWTNCCIEKNITEYKYNQLTIAKNYSSIIEGNFEKLIKNTNVVINKFDNYTEMCNYISDIYVESKEKIKNILNYNDKISSAAILANMSEQFYSVDGSNINDMLKVYFPEQFEQKHFLAYPVGQLILSIYNLWDENKNEIIIKESAIRECLATNIWSKYDEEILYTPLEIFELIKVYFSDLENSNINEYIVRIETLKNRLNRINNSNDLIKKNNYKRLGFYSLTEKEINFFECIIKDIKGIIEILMGDGKEINIIKHYKNLLNLLSEKINSSKDESINKEIEFVNEINERLSKLDSTLNESIGAIKETLHFYLTESKEEDSSNWIVRNFNQIDGGILLADPNAKEKSLKEKKSIYHFMEVSDNDMRGKNKIALSWPLDENFISNSTDVFKIINICKKEYKNYLRCTLFYALFYIGETDIKISYIENKDDNFKNELYYVLKLLNVKEESICVLNNLNFKSKNNNLISNEVIVTDSINSIDIINYNFCEERFLYESLIEGNGCFNNAFLIKHYLKNFVALSLFNKKSTKENLQENIQWVIPYGNLTLINDIIFDATEKVKYFEKYGSIDLFYEDIIKNYVFAKFSEENKSENLTNYKLNFKFKNEILDYLNGANYKEKNKISDKCTYCKYRQICAN